METEQYSIYEADVLRLVKSITIHIKESAEYINRGLEELGYKVDKNRPETWKYYMNLNGDYHESDPDPFIITSKDTLELIEYTKENLSIHPVTAASYIVGSPEYETLVSRNPDSEFLIKAISSPVSLEESLSSENYKILKYDETLIEENEISLIDKLQDRINGHFLNSHNTSYSEIDNLYLAANIAILYVNLPNMILNIRLSNCFTAEAHSFHIWSHLTSYGNLDRWRNVLDNYQQRYLYRNIRWINDKAGQEKIFNELTRILLSRKNIPLYGYDLRHVIDALPDQIAPTNISTRHRIDKSLNVIDFNDNRTIEELSHSIRENARDNSILEEENVAETHLKMSHSNKDRVLTKILELEQVNEAETSEDLAKEMAYYHWIYLSHRNKFNVGIELIHEATNINHSLSTIDALYLYTYCGSVYLNHRLKYIPDFYCYNIKKITFPKRAEVESLNFSKNINTNWIARLFSRQLEVINVTSVLQFNEFCQDLTKNALTDRLEANRFTELIDYNNARLLNRAFWANVCIVPPKQSYESFFNRLFIDPNLITESAALDLMKNIYLLVTGFSDENSSLSSVLKSLVDLMSYLSSYNVTFIYSDLYKDMRRINKSYNRLHLKSIDYSINPFLTHIPAVSIIAEKIKSLIKDKLEILTIACIKDKTSVSNFHKIDLTANVTEISTVKHIDKILIHPIGVIKSV